MSESGSAVILTTLVSLGLEKIAGSAESHPRRNVAKILTRRLNHVNAIFKTNFRAAPAGTSADRGKFLPIIYEDASHCISGQRLQVLEDCVRVRLGQYYLEFRASIEDAKGSLDSVMTVLEELRGNEGDSVSGTPLGPSSVLERTNTKTDDPAPRKVHRLKLLLYALSDNIDHAIRLQKLASGCGERQEGNLWISWLHGLVLTITVAVRSYFASLIARCYSKQSGSTPLAIPSRGPGSETHRTTLADLYTVLSHKIECRCHFVHLSLCSPPMSPLESGFPSTELENPGLICSLFITPDLNNLNTAIDSYVSESPRYLKVSRRRSSIGSATHTVSIPPPSPTRPSSTSCSTIITSPVGSSHCLRCEAPARTEFLVQSDFPTYSQILTLRDILTSHSQEGNTIQLQYEDRLQLAGRLARWVLEHYDTPWLRGLDTQKIRFFTRHENHPNYADWTPYISASLARTSPECQKNNNELRALGSVLLQLGLKKLPSYFPHNDWPKMIKIASHDLPRTFGVKYTRVVEKLLAEEAKGDIMEGEQISYLESEITWIIKRILKFLSE